MVFWQRVPSIWMEDVVVALGYLGTYLAMLIIMFRKGHAGQQLSQAPEAIGLVTLYFPILKIYRWKQHAT